MDVLGAACLADDITWWENDSSDGSSWIKPNIDGVYNVASSVYAADVDGDEDLDVLGIAYHDVNIYWWENMCI